MEKYFEHIGGKISCRRKQISQLYSLIGYSNEPMPYSVFIYGHVAAGKSLVTQSLLSYLRYNVAVIDCTEHTTSRHVYDYILGDLSLGSTDASKAHRRCDTFAEFAISLKAIFASDSRPIVIVLDKCEKLRDQDSGLLPAFSKLKELADVNVCVIFVSGIVWEKFRVRIGVYEPIKIHFPQYTRNEFAEILMASKPHGYEDAFYKNYLNLFLSVFFRFCRDLNELRYMAKVNFSKYVEPLKNDQTKKTDTALLWKNISSVFKANLEVIYLRVCSENFAKHDQLSKEIESTTRLALSFELPYYAKYMLIASYLASYNPAKEDKYLFVKERLRKKKRKNAGKKKAMNAFCGPYNFPVSRMIAIFCAILDEKVDINANLLAQIPSMCQLGLLSLVGTYNLNEPKFKCCVSYDFILVIAKTIGFDVQNYLSNFVS